MVMVEGNTNADNLIHIINHIECEKMMYLLYKIYTERIKPI